jgi:hypothetical protein
MGNTIEELLQDIGSGVVDFAPTEEFLFDLGLDPDWDWGDIVSKVERGDLTVATVEWAVHKTTR